jgi:hypothetical protein
VRQPFAVCFHARPLSGCPAGDQVETSDARWFAIGDIPPCRSARPCACGSITRSPPPAPATSADTGITAPGCQDPASTPGVLTGRRAHRKPLTLLMSFLHNE